MESAFWSSRDPFVPDAVLPDGAEDMMGLVWFQTSGSTGSGKWIGHRREALLLSASVVNRHLEVSGSDVWGLALPCHHVGGFGVIARAYEAGGKLAQCSGKWEARRFVEWLACEQVNHLSLVPTQVHDLVKGQLKAPSCLRAVVVGGGVLDEQTGREARGLGWPVLASYGMTEAGSQIATQSLDQLRSPYVTEPLAILPHWQVQVSDRGQLQIRGDSLYAATLMQNGGKWCFEVREGDGFLTSDLGTVNGSEMSVIGRVDRRVKVLGELIDLSEVEQSLGVSEAIVIALPDERRGSRLVLVCSIGGDDVAMDRYNASVEGPWRIMDRVELEEIPQGALGKVRYRMLAEQVEAILRA